jgi:hypothetical protein
MAMAGAPRSRAVRSRVIMVRMVNPPKLWRIVYPVGFGNVPAPPPVKIITYEL